MVIPKDILNVFGQYLCLKCKGRYCIAIREDCSKLKLRQLKIQKTTDQLLRETSRVKSLMEAPEPVFLTQRLETPGENLAMIEENNDKLDIWKSISAITFRTYHIKEANAGIAKICCIYMYTEFAIYDFPIFEYLDGILEKYGEIELLLRRVLYYQGSRIEKLTTLSDKSIKAIFNIISPSYYEDELRELINYHGDELKKRELFFEHPILVTVASDEELFVEHYHSILESEKGRNWLKNNLECWKPFSRHLPYDLLKALNVTPGYNILRYIDRKYVEESIMEMSLQDDFSEDMDGHLMLARLLSTIVAPDSIPWTPGNMVDEIEISNYLYMAPKLQKLALDDPRREKLVKLFDTLMIK